MKKIILALAVLAAVVCPVFAGESWIGVTTGPAFEISNSDEYKENFETSSVTNYNWDVNIEGAYYFNEAETIGIGAKFGMGFNYATSLDLPADMENPLNKLTIAPAVTFQYRLGLTDALDLRMGAGLQYVYTMGNEVEQYCGSQIGTIKVNGMSFHNLEVIASTDIVYSIGSFQIFGGVDLGVSVMNYTVEETIDMEAISKGSVKYNTKGEFVTDGFQMSITPRIGVSYAF